MLRACRESATEFSPLGDVLLRLRALGREGRELRAEPLACGGQPELPGVDRKHCRQDVAGLLRMQLAGLDRDDPPAGAGELRKRQAWLHSELAESREVVPPG